MKTIDLLGYDVTYKLDDIELNNTIINTINPHSYYVAKKDKLFKKSLNESDILLPDGIGIVLASRIIYGIKINRITGSDIHKLLLKFANQNAYKVFYLGSNNEVLRKIKKRIYMEYPNINVSCFSPQFKSEFTKTDSELMIKKINEYSPHILFVGMTAPKQEKWVFKHKKFISSNIICSIGAVFDWYAGTTTYRSKEFWRNYGLEWFPRLVREPRRLWKRSIISAPLFFLDVVICKFSKN